MSEAEIKGQAFRSYLECVRSVWGPTVAQELIAHLPIELSEARPRRAIVSSGWYPVAWYRSYYAALGALLPGALDLPAIIGQKTAKAELSGIYRFVLNLTSPELIARHIDRVVATFMRGGTVEASVTKGSFVGRFRGWLGVDRTIWQEVLSGGQVILEATGHEVTAALDEQGPGAAVLHYRW
jgi:hypothetical protein